MPRMAMGKRKREQQPAIWMMTTELPTAASHPFYRLNQLLREHRFDDFAEARCATFYAETMGRPSLPPGIYFRVSLIGYFEGIDSERGIAWRAADSFALRDFLGVGLEDQPPDRAAVAVTSGALGSGAARPLTATAGLGYLQRTLRAERLGMAAAMKAAARTACGIPITAWPLPCSATSTRSILGCWRDR